MSEDYTIGRIHVEGLRFGVVGAACSRVSHCTRPFGGIYLRTGEGYLPCPMPIQPYRVERAWASKTSLTIPLALH